MSQVDISTEVHVIGDAKKSIDFELFFTRIEINYKKQAA